MEQPIKVYGALWCPDCRRTLRFLKERQIQFEWVDLEEHPEEKAVVRRRNAGMEVIPTAHLRRRLLPRRAVERGARPQAGSRVGGGATSG